MTFRTRHFLQDKKSHLKKGTDSIADVFRQDHVISTMRYNISAEFIEVFRMGYQNYSQGEWQAAHQLLERIGGPRDKDGLYKDGPSGALLSFMSHHFFEAP